MRRTAPSPAAARIVQSVSRYFARLSVLDFGLSSSAAVAICSSVDNNKRKLAPRNERNSRPDADGRSTEVSVLLLNLLSFLFLSFLSFIQN